MLVYYATILHEQREPFSYSQLRRCPTLQKEAEEDSKYLTDMSNAPMARARDDFWSICEVNRIFQIEIKLYAFFGQFI